MKNKILKNILFAALFSIIALFLISCGKSQNNATVNLTLRAPLYSLQSSVYTATAAVYSENGTLLGSVSAPLINMSGTLALTNIPPQNNVSISVVLKEYNSDTILIRGSKIVNLVEGINSVSLTLGQHQLSFSAGLKYQYIIDNISANNYSIVYWKTANDTNYDAQKTYYISKFDENKGVFVGHYPVFSDTSEYVLSDVGIDSTGNIMIIRYDYYDTNIKIYALPSNSGNVVLLCETSSVYFQNPTIVSDKNQNLKLFFYSSSSSRLFQYALSYNPRNLTQNSGALMYLNSPDLNESLGTYKINYDSNNRLHLTYYKSGYGYYWIYSDNLGDTFSSTKLLYNDYSGGYNNDNFGGLGNGAMFILKHNDPAAVSSLQFSKTTIFSDNPETTVFLTNAGDTKYNSYFSDFVAGCTGVYTFFDLQNITDTKLAVVVFRNFGDTWSSPINIFDTIPINYQSLYASANDRAAKYIAIKNQVSSGGHYYGGITITEAYLLEVFGAYAFHSAASRIIGGSQAPVITPDNIMPVYRGEPQTITCLVEDNDDTAPTVRLWYRGDSLGSFSSVLMQQDIDYQTSYHYTIPGSFTEGTSKIYYYFSAIDKYNNATFVDSSGVYSSAPYIPVPFILNLVQP